MTATPAGIKWREFNGDRSLATKGHQVYGEPVDNGWRRWSRERSKVAGMLERGLPISITADATVLYLGAATGTTVSHLADVVDHVYAVEFSPRAMDQLLTVAEDRTNIYPLLKDARTPESYAHVVESDVDLLIQDVATRGQAAVAIANRQFLAANGQLVLAVKARSEDVTSTPATVFQDVQNKLETAYQITDSVSLEPHHADHQAIVATPSQ